MTTSVSFQQNVSGYNGANDFFIRESRPTSSYTSHSYVDADGADPDGANIQGLLYFSNLFGNELWQIPVGAVITSATLTLTVSNGTRDPVRFHSMVQDWTNQSSWTWNSFGGGIQTDGTEASVDPAVSLSGLLQGIQTLDVTASLRDWASGAPNLGWLLTSLGSDGFRFSGSRSTEAPILNVTYEMPTTPPPGLSVVETDGTTMVTEGGNGDSFSVVLNAAPTSDVTIQITTTGGSSITFSQTSLTFTAANWNTAQTISISAINDTIVEGSEAFSITLTTSSTSPGYDGLTSSFAVSVVDNDAPPPGLKPAVVAVHDLTQWRAGDPSNSGSGDPSGIAYVPELNRLFIVDSEHDESPYFSSVNMFAASLDGTFIKSFSMMSYTKEPTGLCYNPKNGLLYATDDDGRAIVMTNPNDPTVQVRRIDLRPLGIKDPEDPAIDPATGNILVLDGAARTLFELSSTGSLVKKTVLPSDIVDAEAMAFDPAADVFYFAGGATRGTIFQTDRSGNILETMTLLNSYANPITGTKPKIKGLELAPSSDLSDGNRMSLYAVDYGVDQVADGRLFEINLHSDWLVS